jgi:hypothetical protein
MNFNYETVVAMGDDFRIAPRFNHISGTMASPPTPRFLWRGRCSPQGQAMGLTGDMHPTQLSKLRRLHYGLLAPYPHQVNNELPCYDAKELPHGNALRRNVSFSKENFMNNSEKPAVVCQSYHTK